MSGNLFGKEPGKAEDAKLAAKAGVSREEAARVVAEEAAAEQHYQRGRERMEPKPAHKVGERILAKEAADLVPIWPQDDAKVPVAGDKAGLRVISGPEAAYMASFDQTRKLLKDMRKDPALTESERSGAAAMNDLMREGEQGRLQAMSLPHFEVRRALWEHVKVTWRN